MKLESSNAKWGTTLAVMLIIFSLMSCERELNLDGFNSDLWKTDKNGCIGNREKLMPKLEKIKKQLYGISEIQLLKILGNPNQQDLGERNRKRCLYFISKGKQCNTNATETRFLVVDIDALNRVALMSVKLNN